MTETLAPLTSKFLGNTRTLRTILPKDWKASTQKLPLLVVNDGQDWQRLKIRETLENLWGAGTIRPFAVVLIPTGPDRMREYGIPGYPDYHKWGDRADLYRDFLIQEVLPFLEAKYPLDPEDRTILGASLGGLSAFGLAWSQPAVFKKAGILSGSFWWRSGPDSPIVPKWSSQFPLPKNSRFWFQAGTMDETDDRDNDGIIDAVDDTLDLTNQLLALGMPNENLVWTLVEGGKHNLQTWSQVIPDFLIWAYGKKP